MAVAGVVVLLLLILYAFGGALFFSEAYANFNDTKLSLAAPTVAHLIRHGFDWAGYFSPDNLWRPNLLIDRFICGDDRNRCWHI